MYGRTVICEAGVNFQNIWALEFPAGAQSTCVKNLCALHPSPLSHTGTRAAASVEWLMMGRSWAASKMTRDRPLDTAVRNCLIRGIGVGHPSLWVLNCILRVNPTGQECSFSNSLWGGMTSCCQHAFFTKLKHSISQTWRVVSPKTERLCPLKLKDFVP